MRLPAGVRTGSGRPRRILAPRSCYRRLRGMTRLARLRRLSACLTAGVLILAFGCGSKSDAPAIGVSYNFGDTAFEGFLVDELERVRPEGAATLRVVGGSLAYRVEGISFLAAEVRRATMFAADPDVLIAVGPAGSREALQVAPIYREAGIAGLIPTATSRLLASAGTPPFLLAANDSVQGAFIGAFADSVLHARSAVIIHIPDEYGVGLAVGTAAALESRGVGVIDRIPIRVLLDCQRPADRATHEAIADEVGLRGTPDVAVLAMRTVEAGCLARALRARFPAIRLIAGDGTYFDETYTLRAEAAADGTYLVAFWHPDIDRPGSTDFRDRFEARVKRRARHGDAMFFDAVMLAGAAIRATGARRDRVELYLDALGATRPAYEGITGPIAFGPGARRTLFMTRVTAGRSEVVR